MSAPGDALAVSARPDGEIASAMQTEMQVLTKALSVDSIAKSLLVHPGLSSVPQYNVFLDKLKDQCSLSRIAADFHACTSNIGLYVGDAMSALLTAVSHAYAFTPANVPNTTHEHLAAIVPQLPMWCDAHAFSNAFHVLDSFSQRTLDARPVDLLTIERALETLRDISDTCGELLSASTSIKPTSTWETTTQLAWNFGPTMLFSPPPTPEQANSPTPPRKRAVAPGPLAMSNMSAATSRAAKAAFESTPDSTPQPPRMQQAPMYYTSFSNQSSNAPGASAVNSADVDSDPLQLMALINAATTQTDHNQVVPPSPTRRNTAPRLQGFNNGPPPPPAPGIPGLGPAGPGPLGMSAPPLGDAHDDWGGLQFKERPPGFRVVMCRHMDAKGKCKKAGTCTFAHTQGDLEKFRALYIPTERCNFGAKCGKTACRYSHSPAEQHRAIRIYVQNCIAAVKGGAQQP